MATNNVTDATSSYAALIAGKSSDAATNKASASEDMQTRFMTLLMTQLKNQDPLNPTDANQMTAQLSQISTVSGIEKLNATMDKLLASYSGTQNMQAAGMIGKSVLVSGSQLTLVNGTAYGGVNLSGPADQVKLNILNSAGQVLQSQNLGAHDSGVFNFVWDGMTDAGTKAPDGIYKFSVEARQGNSLVAADSLQIGMVSALVKTKSGFLLDLGALGTVDFKNVQQIL